MKNILFVFPLFLMLSCRSGFEAEITLPEIEGHIAYLASDELRGRYPGTPEDRQMSDYLAHEFKKAGLELYEKSGLQNFDIVQEIEAGGGNIFKWGDAELELNRDYAIFPFSYSAAAEGEVVFAGYGFQIDDGELRWDDYASLNVEGKWVMLLRGVPGEQVSTSPYVKLQGKEHALSIPVVQLSRDHASKLLLSAGQDSLTSLDAWLTDALEASSFSTGVEVDITVDLQPVKMETSNVIATLEGSHEGFKNEYVVPTTTTWEWVDQAPPPGLRIPLPSTTEPMIMHREWPVYWKPPNG